MKKTLVLFLALFFIFNVFNFVYANEIVDTTVPVITLIGETTVSITEGDIYIDQGATATDDIDGDLTTSIVVSNLVNTNMIGSYTVTYNVSDTAGNLAEELTRTVYVVMVEPELDTTAPVITLVGEETVFVEQGEEYLDAGATALDETDGDITLNIVISSTLDINTPGEYSVTYNVSDEAGNFATEISRTVIVNTPQNVLTETILIRNGADVVYHGTVDFPESGVVDIVDNEGNMHSVNSQSVLGLLYLLDQADDQFLLSNIQFFSSFNSLYLKCLTILSGEVLCDNWQYVVNGVTPWSGIDTTILTGGETVGLYFGYSHRIELGTTSIHEGGAIGISTQKYDYLYDSWNPLTGVTVGATVPNPNDPWNPIVVVSEMVDENGIATLILNDADVYIIGIIEDYYFPSYTVTVENTPVVFSGGGGGVHIVPPTQFNISSALSYLEDVQDIEGSFGDALLYTDWVAIALGAANINGQMRAQLISYLASHNSISSSLTDNERRAMALLSLEQNPYDFYGVNYINPIIQSFDGIQFGNPYLINDDIFALLPLLSAGYSSSDEVISKDVAFILSKQNIDGSWAGSIDITAAAIQALVPLNNIVGVNESISKASTYLQDVQMSDGGFGEVYATSWVAQAMSAIGVSWSKNGNDPVSYLGQRQIFDGGVLLSSESVQNRIWATSYAIPAVLGLSWNKIMHPVTRQVQSGEINSGIERKNILDDFDEQIVLDKSDDLVTESLDTESPLVIHEQQAIGYQHVEHPIPQKIIQPELVTSLVKNYTPLLNQQLSASVSSSGIILGREWYIIVGIIFLFVFSIAFSKLFF